MSFFGNRRQDTDTPIRVEKPEMPALTVPPQPVGFESVLGANCAIEGTLKSNGNVRLDGTFTGTLEISGNVLVGETAKISADINAKNISIAGAVRGNVTGKKVQLLRTGRIWGDIHATALTTEEGAFIDGKISMISHEAARAAAATPDLPPVIDSSASFDEVRAAMDSDVTQPAAPETPVEPEAPSPTEPTAHD